MKHEKGNVVKFRCSGGILYATVIGIDLNRKIYYLRQSFIMRDGRTVVKNYHVEEHDIVMNVTYGDFSSGLQSVMTELTKL